MAKITPNQVAFIVDKYLCDNNFSKTRSIFLNEASSLVGYSPINEMPKGLVTLGEMLDEYVCLKQQKVMLDQQTVVVMHEKNRLQMLLQGVENFRNAYNVFQSHPSPNVAGICNKTPPAPGVSIATTGIVAVMQNTSNTPSLPKPITINVETDQNFSTPMISGYENKRKDTRAADVPTATKKCRGRPPGRKIPVQDQNRLIPPSNAIDNQEISQPFSSIQSSAENCAPNGSQVQGSNIGKCSFNQPSFPVPTNSPVSRTHSFHSDPCVSPPTGISLIKTNTDKSNKRDQVRSSMLDRLDFDSFGPQRLDKSLPNTVSKSEFDKEVDIHGIDFWNSEMDFSFIPSDLGFTKEDIDFSDFPTPTHPKDI